MRKTSNRQIQYNAENFDKIHASSASVRNMEAIYAPYHWFLTIKMLNRYTTSRTSTKYHEIQLGLPKSKFIMIPVFEH